MRIAIIDDDKLIVNRIKALIYKEFKNSVVDVYINNYEKVYQMEYDIAIFDICLGKISGIDLATAYSILHKKSIIIFISNYDDFVFDVFDIPTFIFIRKRYLEEEFKRFTLKYHTFHSSTFIVIKYKNDIYSIAINDILYVETFHNISYIYADGQKYKCYQSLQNLEKEINSSEFFRINRYVLINLKYLKEVRGRHIYLINGCDFLIPKGKVQIFKEKYIQYLENSRY